ncbi:alpha/beta hydrolase fold protein [Solidesulfovibrio fructosivorans JJ]]|uniref:Alpha/beta hydrolase fold protein n=1 Tax=Solidesulfovibrio fructosivorans JJ] TaxID=596151 RepID=E1JRP6_SOLFR|nr:alpha/beta hydrolase [Solidesulfovibrio fructosivorans]EFL53247.1 alpha/beta hydrolase fold protein [Solidesulfovibrio fructosivorans JJ]]
MKTAPSPWIMPELPQPTIAATRRGPVEYATFGQGPAVLALHGAMGGYDQSALLALAAGPSGSRTIAVSRPGYLGTPLGEHGAPEAQADLCLALLDALGIETAAVMAISGGGPCALQFALRHPGRCRGLILVSTCAGIVETPIPFTFRVMLRVAGWPICGALLRAGKPDVRRAARRSVRDQALCKRMLADPHTAGLFASLVASTADRLGRRAAGTRNDIAVTRNTRYRLEDIAAPTLVIHGTNDPHLPYAQHGKQLAARIPQARLVTAEGGEHACLFTHRDMIRTEVASFLATLPA